MFGSRKPIWGQRSNTNYNIHHNEGETAIPRYCLVLIGQRQTAQGLPPIVWIFHQIMGSAPPPHVKKAMKQQRHTKKQHQNTNSHMVARTASSSLQHQEQQQPVVVESLLPSLVADPAGPLQSFLSVDRDAKTGRFCFRCDSSLQLKVEFPAPLLKILPMSRRKAESMGCSAIRKTVSKASRSGVKALFQEFIIHGAACHTATTSSSSTLLMARMKTSSRRNN